MGPLRSLFSRFRRSSHQTTSVETAPEMTQQEKTSFIFPTIETTVELSPLDHYGTTFACIPWSTFYNYDLSADKLKEALERIAERYPVVCGRLKTKVDSRVEIVVKKDAGFSFTETQSEMSLAEAVGEARIVEQPADFPSFPPLPFFSAQMVTVTMLDQDAPVLMVKLTHFRDGTCCLAVTVHHTVADAQRLAELMADISAAYRGEELRQLDHDRSRAWPDQLLSKVPVGPDPKDFPRKVTTPFDQLPLPKFPEEKYSLESIYYPIEAIEALKKKISERLKDVEYVSQIDVLTAALWMVKGEMAAVREGRKDTVKTAGDLKIHQSNCLFFVDLISNNSPLIPENFFGNAYFGTLASVPEAATEEEKSMDLIDTAVAVASVMRKAVLTMRTPPAQVMSCIYVYKALSEVPPYPPVLSGISSFYKMPFDKMDYGKGLPVFNYGLPSYPFADVWGAICPVSNGSGILVNQVVRSVDRDTLINSTVLKELVPGYVVLSEKKPAEVAKLFAFDVAEA